MSGKGLAGADSPTLGPGWRRGRVMVRGATGVRGSRRRLMCSPELCSPCAEWAGDAEGREGLSPSSTEWRCVVRRGRTPLCPYGTSPPAERGERGGCCGAFGVRRGLGAVAVNWEVRDSCLRRNDGKGRGADSGRDDFFEGRLVHSQRRTQPFGKRLKLIRTRDADAEVASKAGVAVGPGEDASFGETIVQLPA